MIRIVTYDDWQMNFDPQTGTYFASDENGTYECVLVGISNDKEHTDKELLCGDFVKEPFDFGGEFDNPTEVDLGIIDGVHKFDYIYNYGYWKKVGKIL